MYFVTLFLAPTCFFFFFTKTVISSTTIFPQNPCDPWNFSFFFVVVISYVDENLNMEMEVKNITKWKNATRKRRNKSKKCQTKQNIIMTLVPIQNGIDWCTFYGQIHFYRKWQQTRSNNVKNVVIRMRLKLNFSK